MRVELDVCDGRHSRPVWMLSQAEARELARRLAGVPSSGPPPEKPACGYRGFVIDNTTRLERLPAIVQVFNGLLIEDRPYGDTNGIEAWLIDLARQRGFADLLDDLGR